MKIYTIQSLYIATLLVAFSCNDTQSINNTQVTSSPSINNNNWVIELEELADSDYIHNPDISIRHSKSEKCDYLNLELTRNIDSTFTFTFIPQNTDDTITLDAIKLMEWIPTICEKAKSDDYLAEIAIVNQEWNRHQVKFTEGKFKVSGTNKHNVKRVDLARNCLNAYLWEIITYAKEDGKLKPYYHGWFNFPPDLYGELFQKRNDVGYDKYKAPLEEWDDPESKVIDFSKLRTISTEKTVTFTNLNNSNYPLIGERKKKHINIVYPKNTTYIDDFLTDSTQFATFSPPGFYNPEDPRHTKLSLLKYIKQINYRELESNLFEIEIDYFNTDSSKITKLFISGLNPKDIPSLATENVNDGWKNSMGFGNHTFYETYEHCLDNSSKDSEYFSLLTNENNEWLDSHFIGIDGPLLHWDSENDNLLHIWILAFERHAFVGHYTIEIN